MSIVADKNAKGQLTGRFRVELQRGKDRYRQRHDTYQAAQADEERVKSLWATGSTQVPQAAPQEAPAGVSMAKGIALAQGNLWEGTSTEETCWAHVKAAHEVFGPHILLDEIDTQMIDRLIQELRRRDKAPGTINRYLSHLRSFLSWCVDRDHRKVPLKKGMFAWRKEPVGRIRWITQDEEQAIYAYLESRQGPEALGVRALIEVAIETGCRRDELLTAELGQINGHRLHLWETKTDTPRTVPMSERTTRLLTHLIETGTMPTRRGLRSWWQRVRKHLGLLEDADFVFHACRHTRATRMVDAGINVFVIKEWMGHKRIETTQRYAHVRPQTLEEALLRVGEHRVAAGQKSSISAANDVPHTLPHGGGNAPETMAA